MTKIIPEFKTIYIEPNNLIKIYLKSFFIDCKYDLTNEIFKSTNVDICYFCDLGINESYEEILINLRELFHPNALIKCTFHIFRSKFYLVIPQSYFLDKDFYKINYLNEVENE